jgi:hypothetical protein
MFRNILHAFIRPYLYVHTPEMRDKKTKINPTLPSSHVTNSRGQDRITKYILRVVRRSKTCILIANQHSVSSPVHISCKQNCKFRGIEAIPQCVTGRFNGHASSMNFKQTWPTPCLASFNWDVNLPDTVSWYMPTAAWPAGGSRATYGCRPLVTIQ